MNNPCNNTYFCTDLSFCVGDEVYRLPIRSARISIAGNSGIGKTYLYNTLQDMQPESLIGSNAAGFRNSMRFLNHTKTTDEVIESLKHNKNKLIIMDNADILLDFTGAKELLDSSQNQFILFSRRGSKYGINGMNRSHLYRDNKTLYLSYEENF